MTMTTELDDTSLRQIRVTALEKLDNAVCSALADVEGDDARRGLREAVAACTAAGAVMSPQVMGCVKAAEEHLGYGERMEARMLLTVAHRLLTGVRSAMVVPGPSTPGDVVLGR
ncbi:hypothetical protein V1227_03520 [Lentzea sp. DG1S-22]|uniref:hypothetical protein n=1 Tax=Lentzea sp. DG1S-22 TaxID=3108822 RepID=UPI002E75B3A6|nr:hypothetical protein [Lentzea sp. DG1S-22]WVH81836.1 hypothetical protein V1227_03520 [Lentzea sp. DG1S-22]